MCQHDDNCNSVHGFALIESYVDGESKHGESRRNGSEVCGVPVGKETDVAGLPRGWKEIMEFLQR